MESQKRLFDVSLKFTTADGAEMTKTFRVPNTSIAIRECKKEHPGVSKIYIIQAIKVAFQ